MAARFFKLTKFLLLLLSIICISALAVKAQEKNKPDDTEEPSSRELFASSPFAGQGKVTASVITSGIVTNKNTRRQPTTKNEPNRKKKEPTKKVVTTPKFTKKTTTKKVKIAPKKRRPRLGVQVKMELKTDDGSEFVSPQNSEFKTGDKWRLQFKVNYPAYVAVLARQSSGSFVLMFPCAGDNNFIPPMSFFTIPTNPSKLFEFKEPAGEENLTFIMSQRKIPLVEVLQQSGLTICDKQNSANENDRMELSRLEEEATEAFQNRDISLVDDTDIDENSKKITKASYFLVPEELLIKVTGFRLKLVHR
jgi:hypothetical protein